MESKEILLLLIAICGISIDCISTKRQQQKYTIKFDGLSKDFCLQNHTANCHDRCASVGYTDEWFCDVTGSDSFCNCKFFDPASAVAPAASIKDSVWHIIIGGENSSNTVELYNWETQKQCFMEPLPGEFFGHLGAVMNGVPVVCGESFDCFRYQKDTKKWIQISSLLWHNIDAPSVNVPGKGWFIFNDNNSQKLANLNSSWENGPVLAGVGLFTCIVQLNETVTAFIGGTSNATSIFTYDWSSPQPTLVRQNITLQKPRIRSACDLFVSKTGDPVVAIIGGVHVTGMDVWNPRTNTVQSFFDYEPSELYSNGHRQLLAIKGGSELILYVGFYGSPMSDIWKYVVSSNTWNKIGNLLSPRYNDHVALRVSGIECPN